MPHLVPYIQPRIFWYANVAFTIFDLSGVYSLLVIFLRHICREQICEIPFFGPVNGICY